MYIRPLEKIIDEYASKKLKVRPHLEFYTNFKMPVQLFINSEVIEPLYVSVRIHTIPRMAINPNLGFRVNLWAKVSGSMYNGFNLPSNYKLKDIENIDVKIGNPSYSDIEIRFGGGGEVEKLF